MLKGRLFLWFWVGGGVFMDNECACGRASAVYESGFTRVETVTHARGGKQVTEVRLGLRLG